MLTKKKWYAAWEEYSSLMQKKERDGEFFTEERQLEEVREKLRKYLDTVGGRIRGELIAIYQQRRICTRRHRKLAKNFDLLAEKFYLHEAVLEEDYKGAYFPCIDAHLYGCTLVVVMVLAGKLLGWF